MPDARPILPPHLARHVVDQAYDAYTPRDQAVWRHILTRLTTHLAHRAHPSYLEGLASAGIGVEAIPRLEEMDARLQRIGWRAVGVRGFIPPAVFTELQSLGILAIAADIRSVEHVPYTPAPDIVHESAGHAPILADPAYAAYLKRCGTAGFKAIASLEDKAVYQAVRHLSVVKEDPACGPAEVAEAQARLEAARAARTYASESVKASRLYWWTAEYGLVGPESDPRIYGAGLLSSLGEAVHCLGPEVRRVPLSLACVERDFDITAMQPLLYVARDFDHLTEVLEAFEATLSWRRGGEHGLREAMRARTVNHLVLDTGAQLSGRVVAVEPGLAVLAGPVQVAVRGRAQGEPWPGHAVVLLDAGDPPRVGDFRLETPGGVELSGLRLEGGEVLDLEGWAGGRDLELPAEALLFTADAVVSVAGGPADPEAWDRRFGQDPGEADAERRARDRRRRALDPALAALYQEVRDLRAAGRVEPARLNAIQAALEAWPGEWLLAEEVAELRPSGAPQEKVGAAAGPRCVERP